MRRISSHRSDSRREDQRSRGGSSFVPEPPWKYESRWSFAHIIGRQSLTQMITLRPIDHLSSCGILVLNGL